MSPQHAASDSGSLRVFVVENHDDTRAPLTQLLTMLGHEVRCGASMQEALPAVDPDVVLSDIGLPDGDGWEFMQRAHFPHEVYAIAMSGYGMSDDRERSAAAGFSPSPGEADEHRAARGAARRSRPRMPRATEDSRRALMDVARGRRPMLDD